MCRLCDDDLKYGHLGDERTCVHIGCGWQGEHSEMFYCGDTGPLCSSCYAEMEELVD